MSNQDFSFMKSGFDNLESKPKMNNIETSQVLAVMTIFMENAIKIAEKITISEDRVNIYDTDIIKALKSQALDNYDIWNQDEVKRDLVEISQSIYHDIVESQSREIGDSDNELSDEECIEQEDEDKEIDNEKILEIKQSITREFIEKIKTIDTRWNNWNPVETEYVILKNAIENTEKKFNGKTI